MRKRNSKIVNTINNVLLVVIVLFLVLALALRISTGMPKKETDHVENMDGDSAISMEENNEMYQEEQEEQEEWQEYKAISGFKVSAKSKDKEKNQDPDKTDADADTDTDEFSFPDSYKKKLSVSDVESLNTSKEVQDAINYIYARSGCIFRDEEKQAYYEKFDWYEGSYSVEEMNQNPLNYMSEVQYENIQLLAKRRNELN